MPPKNPVRAARQASRQAVRSARITNRQDARTIRTAAKVDKIVKRTATKVNKINDKVVTRANKEPMTKMEPKGMTKIEPKGGSKVGSTGLVPAPQLTGPKPSTPRSVTPAAPVKKTAPVKKSTPKPKATPKRTGPQLTPQGKAAVAKADADRYRKDREQGTYVTKPESRNQQQKDKLVKDNARGVVADLIAIQEKALRNAKAAPKNEDKYAASDRAAKKSLNERRAKLGLPPMKMGGSAYKYGGMKGKKC